MALMMESRNAAVMAQYLTEMVGTALDTKPGGMTPIKGEVGWHAFQNRMYLDLRYDLGCPADQRPREVLDKVSDILRMQLSSDQRAERLQADRQGLRFRGTAAAQAKPKRKPPRLRLILRGY